MAKKIVIEKKRYTPKEKPVKETSIEELPSESELEDIELDELIEEIDKEMNVSNPEEEDFSLVGEIQEQAEKLMDLPLEETPQEPVVETTVETPSAAEPVKEVKTQEEEPTFVRIIQKGPTQYRLLFSDGSTRWVPKKDFKI